MYAPIIVFAYNRPQYLSRCLRALNACNNADKYELYFFLDAPNAKKPGDDGLCDEVYNIAESTRNGGVFKETHILRADRHKGCRENVKEGFDFIFEKYDSTIDVEDDICVAPDFLDFINEGLERFKDDERVFSITGYTPPIVEDIQLKQDAVLIKRFCSWGFGIWKDRWEKVDYSRMDYHKDPMLMERFSAYGYDLPEMLMCEEIDILDTWDVQVCLAECRYNMRTLYPRQSKCINIGVNGTHTSGTEAEESVESVPAWKYDLNNARANKDIDTKMPSVTQSYDGYNNWSASKYYWKYRAYNYVLKTMLKLKQNKMDLASFFIERGIENLAIYGLTDVGEMLCGELSDSGINILGYIDKNARFEGREKSGIKIYTNPEKILSECDCVVVTPLVDHYEIKEYLKLYIDERKIFTIAEVIR